MESSFLLLSCANHKQIDVVDVLHRIEGVKEVIPVYGVYDCIVKTERMNSKNTTKLVSSKIRKINHVLSVLVLSTSNILRK
ncbi:MAG: hypothetical protein KC483_03830 [Nitrosarchaeum sp.]|nr:hypothetical protein [Nitrosarchaeum sp.]MCA9820064.1 hypothetical protein [Nitrosarchaeum sp.]